MTHPTLIEFLSRTQGIAHRKAVYEAGFSTHAVAAAVRSGDVSSVRRQWLVTRNCPPALLHAASVGGHLTCVSAAAYLGLWVLDRDGRCHVALSGSSGQTVDRNRTRVHYGAVPVPRPRRLLVDPVVNILVNAAGCLSFEGAVALAESAVRTGRVSLEGLRRVRSRSRAFRRVVAETRPSSDSGIETIPRLRLAACGVRMQQQVMLRGHRVDGLVGDCLVLQFDGSDHLTARQKQIDARHDVELQLRGFIVLRFTYRDVIEHWGQVERQILTAIAQGAHQFAGHGASAGR